MLAALQRKLDAAGFRELAHQVVLYGVVGGVQLLLDYLVFVALTSAGVGIVPGNLVARVSGATLGYFLNRRVTFVRNTSSESRESAIMLRFVLVWVLLTLLGTLVLDWFGSITSLKLVWLVKPITDAFLAALGFLMSRYWVYK